MEFVAEGGVVEGEDLGGEDAGVGGAGVAEGEGRHGDAAGHLHGGEQGVQTVHGATLHGHADHGERGVARDDAGQVGGQARGADEHLKAAAFGLGRVGGGAVGGAVRAHDVGFKGDAELLEHAHATLHGAPIGVAAHDDADQRIVHDVSLSVEMFEGLGRDVAAEVGPLEVDFGDAGIGRVDRRTEVVAVGRDGEHAPAGGDGLAVLACGAGVEDRATGGLGLGDARDGEAFGVGGGIAGRGHHHRDRRAGADLHGGGVEATLGAGQQDGGEVTQQARQDDLRLGVAEAAVELQHVHALGADHQAAEEDAFVDDAALAELGERGENDAVAHLRHHVGRRDGGGGVGTHAAGVGAFVVVVDALVVLRRGQEGDVLAVAQGEDGGFLAFQKFLDEDLRAGRAETPAVEHVAYGGLGLVARLGDDHALAGGQTIGLDDHGEREVLQALDGGGGVRVDLRAGRGYAGGFHDFLGEGFATLQARRGLAGAKDLEPLGLERIRQPRTERRLRSHDHQVGTVFLGPRHERGEVLRADGHIGGQGRRPGVAGRAEKGMPSGVLRQSPNNGVLPPAVTNHQNLHVY